LFSRPVGLWRRGPSPTVRTRRRRRRRRRRRPRDSDTRGAGRRPRAGREVGAVHGDPARGSGGRRYGQVLASAGAQANLDWRSAGDHRPLGDRVFQGPDGSAAKCRGLEETCFFPSPCVGRVWRGERRCSEDVSPDPSFLTARLQVASCSVAQSCSRPREVFLKMKHPRVRSSKNHPTLRYSIASWIFYFKSS
jgi:hypothetical protein